mmetsp:Transcript_9148/g.12978  ORF Transcript_9148/g.12978 Transcript_9148/m.12978 type:complete len:279 (-) Transcript_9148:903-1739(-)
MFIRGLNFFCLCRGSWFGFFSRCWLLSPRNIDGRRCSTGAKWREVCARKVKATLFGALLWLRCSGSIAVSRLSQFSCCFLVGLADFSSCGHTSSWLFRIPLFLGFQFLDRFGNHFKASGWCEVQKSELFERIHVDGEWTSRSLIQSFLASGLLLLTPFTLGKEIFFLFLSRFKSSKRIFLNGNNFSLPFGFKFGFLLSLLLFFSNKISLSKIVGEIVTESLLCLIRNFLSFLFLFLFEPFSLFFFPLLLLLFVLNLFLCTDRSLIIIPVVVLFTIFCS